MIFNSYEEEIDYILEYHGHSVLVLSQDEDWILYDDYMNPYEYWNYNQDNCLKEVSKINWLKEGF